MPLPGCGSLDWAFQQHLLRVQQGALEAHPRFHWGQPFQNFVQLNKVIAVFLKNKPTLPGIWTCIWLSLWCTNFLFGQRKQCHQCWASPLRQCQLCISENTKLQIEHKKYIRNLYLFAFFYISLHSRRCANQQQALFVRTLYLFCLNMQHLWFF